MNFIRLNLLLYKYGDEKLWKWATSSQRWISSDSRVLHKWVYPYPPPTQLPSEPPSLVRAHLSMGNWVQELDARCMQQFDQKLTQIKVAMLGQPPTQPIQRQNIWIFITRKLVWVDTVCASGSDNNASKGGIPKISIPCLDHCKLIWQCIKFVYKSVSASVWKCHINGTVKQCKWILGRVKQCKCKNLNCFALFFSHLHLFFGIVLYFHFFHSFIFFVFKF
jgi:hypothetical protein